MRVGDYNHFSLVIFDLLVHLIQFISWEFLGVELEVLVILCVQYVHPINVYWESVRLKIRVSLHHNVGTYFSVLAEMVSQSFDWWHWSMSSYGCQVFKLGLG
jgi:hypothetical protein